MSLWNLCVLSQSYSICDDLLIYSLGVKFLDILPNAIEIDESLKNANFLYEASVDDAKASRSSIYPKATLTATGQEQDDVKPAAANDNYTQRELKLEIKGKS